MNKSIIPQPQISDNALLEIKHHLQQIKCLAFAMIAALESKQNRSEDDDIEVRDIKATELFDFDESALLKSFAGAFYEEFSSVDGYLGGLMKISDQK